MIGLKCRKARRLLIDLLDAQRSGGQQDPDVEAHVATCKECQKYFAEMAAIDNHGFDVIGHDAKVVELSEERRSSIRRNVMQEIAPLAAARGRRAKKPVRSFRWYAAVTVPVAACLLMTVYIAWHSWFARRSPTIELETRFDRTLGPGSPATDATFRLEIHLFGPTYIYIIGYDSTANVVLMFPGEGETALLKDQNVYIPSNGSWRLAPPGGTQVLLCIASNEEISKSDMDDLIDKLPGVGRIPDLPDGVEFKLRDEGWRQRSSEEMSEQRTASQRKKLEGLRRLIETALVKYRPTIRGLAFLQSTN